MGKRYRHARLNGRWTRRTHDHLVSQIEGFLHVEGRIKDTIVTGGENVAAAEVEEALLAHPAVADAAVVGRPDAEWGERVTAFVVANGVGDEELVAWCRERLAGYKVPRSIVRVEELPRTESGKLLKGRLSG